MIINNLSHIAFILDGNKRWAKKNNLPTINGYKVGFNNIEKLVDYSLKINISELTLFTLSSENYKRPSIKFIYEIIYNNFPKLIEDLFKTKDIKVKIFGSRINLPTKINEIFTEVENLTKNNKSLKLNLAFNYGFKDELKDVLLKFKENIDKIDIESEEQINKLFFLNGSKDPDILIRTGGYQRLSNFIMYNLTYTELFFTKTLWPEFSIEEFDKILKLYSSIDRKYGL